MKKLSSLCEAVFGSETDYAVADHISDEEIAGDNFKHVNDRLGCTNERLKRHSTSELVQLS